MRLFQAILWCSLLAVSCGCQEAPTQQTYRVKGRLFVDDNLAAKACIAFHPIDKVKSQGRCSVAMTQRDGSFELTTYAMHDGAPEGDYTVTVIWPDDSMPEDECECIDLLQHDRLSGKYADPKTTSLLVTILPRDNHVNLCTEGGKRIGAISKAGTAFRGRIADAVYEPVPKFSD